MNIPFLGFLKKKVSKAQPFPGAARVAREKRSGARLSKTVMPHSVRTVGASDAFETGGNSTAAASPGRSLAFGISSVPTHANNDLPPIISLALEPKVERVISLELSEIAPQMPTGWIRPVSETEAGRRVLLKAAELEKGMANGRPTVSLTSIYRQIPEIFLRPVPEADGSLVPLPFTKVMEEFTNLHTRTDQVRDDAVPQVETPFLRATLEDNSKFGLPTTHVAAADKPPVKVRPATAKNIAAAEPEAVATGEVQIAPPSVQMPANGHSVDGLTPTEQEGATSAEPSRIPFKFSPIGTGAPASERVPASRGPSVPTSAQAPTRIPFKLAPANGNGNAVADPWLTKESLPDGSDSTPGAIEPNDTSVPVSMPASSAPALTISLSLRPILNALPPIQLTGDLATVPEDAHIELPFSLVAPQLATGRIAIQSAEFAAALPEEFKALFNYAELNTPVVLPLQDVLKNLPATSLRMRDDQVEQEKGSAFETPFSAKAAEDAKRFQTAALKPEKATTSPATDEPAPSAMAEIEESPAAHGDSEATSSEPAPAEEVDGKAAIAAAEALPGVQGCAILFEDGLSLAGNLPTEYNADGLCAMAPSFVQKLEGHLKQTNLGAFSAMTITCTKASISFFMHDNVCLAALHVEPALEAAVQDRLGELVHELSKKYSHPA